MKVVILAGGFGARISEITELKPKPMVEIGGKPILWHIMKIYSHYGFNEFVICLGYKGHLIKEYFVNYSIHQSDVVVDLKKNRIDFHNYKAEPWKVSLVETGYNVMTAGRIKRIREHIGNEAFMLTYGDGVADIDLRKLLEYHREHKRHATLTAVQPSGRFGSMVLDEAGKVTVFHEKPKGDGGWVNGGFFVLEPQIFDYIAGDESVWEREPLEDLAKQNQLIACKHNGFWMCMDTLRDKKELERLWQTENPPWRVWGK